MATKRIAAGAYNLVQLQCMVEDLKQQEEREGAKFAPGTRVQTKGSKITGMVINPTSYLSTEIPSPEFRKSHTILVATDDGGDLLYYAPESLEPLEVEATRLEATRLVLPPDMYRVDVPAGAKVEIRYQGESGTAYYVQLRDHAATYGIDQRGDIIDQLQEQRDTAEQRARQAYGDYNLPWRR